MMVMIYDRPAPPPTRRRHSRRRRLLGGLLVLFVAAYGAIAIARPFQQLQPSVAHDTLSITTPASTLPWPSYGQGAFGLIDGRVIAMHGEQTPLATASTAKLITALCVLQKRPLTSSSASGPTITMSSQDVALYQQYIAVHGSVLPVAAGQQLTERQMLQAILLPSANNIADSLAIWAFGSLKNYKTYADSYLTQHGLQATVVGSDASGFAPDSTSTSSDLVKLGALAMAHPVVASLVAQKTAVIPGVGTVRNVDSLLGISNIVGVKTGNSDQNGGVFVGAAVANVNGKQVTLISALSGASSLGQVLSDSARLLAALQTTFSQTTIVKAGTVLGTYHTANGSLVQAVAAKDLDITILRGDRVAATVNLKPISYKATAGQTVGSVSLPTTSFSSAQSVPIVLKQTPAKPGLLYRLRHP